MVNTFREPIDTVLKLLGLKSVRQDSLKDKHSPLLLSCVPLCTANVREGKLAEVNTRSLTRRAETDLCAS